MGKAAISEAEFSRVIVARVRRERPDLRVKAMGKCLLLVEGPAGEQRMVSLLDLYRAYREGPLEQDEAITDFLTAVVYEEPGAIHGSFMENQHQILPQVVPHNLLELCRHENRELAAVEYMDGLSIAFVLDEPDRYTYIQQALLKQWGITELQLLQASITNLQAITHEAIPYHRIGKGRRLTLVWETFDGYDSSRILLTRMLTEMAAQIPGNPVIAVPHRDYLVVFGDSDEEFFTEMAERVQMEFDEHSYPVSPQLFTLVNGNLMPYPGRSRCFRLVN